MAEYKLSERARQKPADIQAFAENRFGRDQADACATGLERTSGLLSDVSKVGSQAEDLAPLHRRFHFQSHHNFYTEEPYGVLIRDVFHVAQDIRAELFR